MPRPKIAHRITLPGGKVVVLTELRSSELLLADEMIGNAYTTQGAKSLASGLEGLRMSIREISDRKVTRGDLEGDKLDDEFTATELAILSHRYALLHSASDDTLKAVTAGMTLVVEQS